MLATPPSNVAESALAQLDEHLELKGGVPIKELQNLVLKLPHGLSSLLGCFRSGLALPMN